MSYTADITEKRQTTPDAEIRPRAIILDGSTINVVWAAWASKDDYLANPDEPLRGRGQTVVTQAEDPELFQSALDAFEGAKAKAPSEMAYLIAETLRAEKPEQLDRVLAGAEAKIETGQTPTKPLTRRGR